LVIAIAAFEKSGFGTLLRSLRKNQDFAFDYFLSPKAMPAAGYANA